jgi:hypothetical protein
MTRRTFHFKPKSSFGESWDIAWFSNTPAATILKVPKSEKDSRPEKRVTIDRIDDDGSFWQSIPK